MKLYLKYPTKKALTPLFLFEGLVVGRSSKAHLQVKDPQISALHAKIEKQNRSWILKDLKSANGIMLKGRKVNRLKLKPGMEFELGKTLFKVMLKQESWRGTVYKFLKAALKTKIKNQPKIVFPLTHAITFTFVSGLQEGERWTVGYAPRCVGKASLDLTLFEPTAPEEAFTLNTSKKNVVYETQTPEVVLLNDEPKTSATLKEGDIIQIGKTKIKVGFVD